MIAIIGAGIAGLATGLALKQQGIDFQIFERTSKLNAIGAGIILSPNAMYVMAQLGLDAEIKATAIPFKTFSLKKPNGKTLQENPTTISVNNELYQSMGIPRARLHKILSSLISDKIQLSKNLIAIDGNTLAFEDGTSVSCTSIIAAEGIHSTLRKQYFPQATLRYSGQSCWRALVDFELPAEYLNNPAEYWGNGIRFGCIPVARDKVYFYATCAQPVCQTIESAKAYLINAFKEFHSPITDIIAATNNNDIVQHDLWDFTPISSYHKDNLLLIGDAAHAMTPNLGQGAAQSLEDALILSRCITATDTHIAAFSAFEKQRIHKVKPLIKMAWRIGQATNWRNPTVCAVRNLLISATPKSVAQKQLQTLMKGLA